MSPPLLLLLPPLLLLPHPAHATTGQSFAPSLIPVSTALVPHASPPRLLIGDPHRDAGVVAQFVFERGEWVDGGESISPPTPGTLFGYALAAVGTHYLVGMPFADVPGADSAEEPDIGMAFLIDVDDSSVVCSLHAEGPGVSNVDSIGGATAMDSDWLVVGSRPAQQINPAAYIYARDTNCTFSARLQLPEGTATPYGFGSSVSVAAGRVAVGVDDYTGGAHLFRFTATGAWVFEASFEPPFGLGLDRWGISVALSAHLLVVGAFGAAHAISLDTRQLRQLDTPSTLDPAQASFGQSIAADPATGRFAVAASLGAAIVVYSANASVDVVLKLTRAETVAALDMANDQVVSALPPLVEWFGTTVSVLPVRVAPPSNDHVRTASVALHGDFAVLSSRTGTGRDSSHRADLFLLEGPTVFHVQDLLLDDTFGIVAAISDTHAVVAPTDTTGGRLGSVFVLPSGDFESDLIVASGGASSQWAIGISGSSIAVGQAVQNQVLVFSLSSTWTHTQTLTSPGEEFFGAALSMDDARMVVSTEFANGSVYKRDADGRYLFEATLVVPSHSPGSFAALSGQHALVGSYSSVHAYLLDDGGEWQPLGPLGKAGSSIALLGDFAVVGTDDDALAVFAWSSSGWDLFQEFRIADSPGLGLRLAAHEGRVLVGTADVDAVVLGTCATLAVAADPTQIPVELGGALELEFEASPQCALVARLEAVPVNVELVESVFGILAVIPPLPVATIGSTLDLTICGLFECQMLASVVHVVPTPLLLGPPNLFVEPQSTMELPGEYLDTALTTIDLVNAVCDLYTLTGDLTTVRADLSANATLLCPVPFYPSYPVVLNVYLRLERQFGGRSNSIQQRGPVTVTPLPVITQVTPRRLVALGNESVALVGTGMLPGETTRCILGNGERIVPREIDSDGRRMVCDINWSTRPRTTTITVGLSEDFVSPSLHVLEIVSEPAVIAVLQQPPAAILGEGQTIAIQAQVRDAFGDVPDLSGAPTMTVTVVGPGSLFAGTAQVLIDVGGIALFDDLRLIAPRNATLWLLFETAGLTVLSDPIRVLQCDEIGRPFVAEDPSLTSNCVCAAGAEALGADPTDCTPCQAGTFKESAGPGRCEACPAGLTTIDAGAESAESCVCVSGTFSLMDDRVCGACPTGAVCDAGRPVTGAPGHWLLFQDAGVPVPIECDVPSVCAGNNTCATGYAGLACLECAPSYGHVGQFCVACPPHAANMALIAVALTVLLGVIGIAMSTATRKRSEAAVVTRVLLNHLQTLALFAHYSADWPSAVAAALGLTAAFVPSSQTMSVDCAIGLSVYDEFFIAVAIPLVTLSIVACAYAAAVMLGRPKADRDRAAVYGVLVLLLVHPSVTRSTLAPMRCRSLGPAGTFLALDPGVSCETDEHRGFLIAAALWFVVYCVGALAVAVRVVLRDSTGAIATFLRSGYRREATYWEAVTMARKLLVMVAVLAVERGSVQIFVGQTIMLGALALHHLRDPFWSPVAARLESASLMVLLMTLAAAATFLSDGGTESERIGLTTVVIGSNGALLIAFSAAEVIVRRRAGKVSEIQT